MDVCKSKSYETDLSQPRAEMAQTLSDRSLVSKSHIKMTLIQHCRIKTMKTWVFSLLQLLVVASVYRHSTRNYIKMPDPRWLFSEMGTVNFNEVDYQSRTFNLVFNHKSFQ